MFFRCELYARRGPWRYGDRGKTASQALEWRFYDDTRSRSSRQHHLLRRAFCGGMNKKLKIYRERRTEDEEKKKAEKMAFDSGSKPTRQLGRSARNASKQKGGDIAHSETRIGYRQENGKINMAN